MTCNCAGTAPGYPQHETYCGQEPDEDSCPACHGDPPPREIFECSCGGTGRARDED